MIVWIFCRSRRHRMSIRCLKGLAGITPLSIPARSFDCPRVYLTVHRVNPPPISRHLITSPDSPGDYSTSNATSTFVGSHRRILSATILPGLCTSRRFMQISKSRDAPRATSRTHSSRVRTAIKPGRVLFPVFSLFFARLTPVARPR